MDSREAAKHSSKDEDGLFQKLKPNRHPESAAGKEETLKLDPQSDTHEPSKGEKEPEAKATAMSEIKGIGDPDHQQDKETGTGTGTSEEDTQQAQAKRELDNIFKASPGMFIVTIYLGNHLGWEFSNHIL